jgi:hypothetical protein
MTRQTSIDGGPEVEDHWDDPGRKPAISITRLLFSHRSTLTQPVGCCTELGSGQRVGTRNANGDARLCDVAAN